MKELLKGKQLLLSIKDVKEENVVEEEDMEELLKFTQKEGVMVEIPKALVHRWKCQESNGSVVEPVLNGAVDPGLRPRLRSKCRRTRVQVSHINAPTYALLL